jgi:hypothetical protein
MRHNIYSITVNPLISIQEVLVQIPARKLTVMAEISVVFMVSPGVSVVFYGLSRQITR